MKKKENDSRESVKRRLEVAQQLQELEDLKRAVENVQPEILEAYQQNATLLQEEASKKNALDR